MSSADPSGGASAPPEVPRQHAAAPGGPPPDVAVFDLRGRDDARSAFQVHAETLQAAFDLSQGPLFRLAIFLQDAGDRLLIVVHHLVTDVVSWRVLVEELDAIVRGLELPPVTDAFLQCAVAANRVAETGEIASQREYWDAIDARVREQSDPGQLHQRARFRDQARTHMTLSREETLLLLTRVNHAYNTTTEDILLAALARALHARMGRVDIPLTLEHHGRDAIGEADASRTVGWFTSLFPFVLALDPARDLAFHIKATKEALRAVPRRGIGYGWLRYASHPPHPSHAPNLTHPSHAPNLTHPSHPSPKPEMSFNYLGQIDARAGDTVFSIAPESVSGWMNPDAACLAEIEMSALIAAGTLHLAIAYNQRRFADRDMHALLECWRAEIVAAIEHCRTRTGTEATPADLTYSGLSVDELEDMFS